MADLAVRGIVGSESQSTDQDDHELELDQFEPRVYQQVMFAVAAEKNSLIVLPTGTGKTLIAMMLAKYVLGKTAAQDVKVLIMAPTRPLVAQLAEEFGKYLQCAVFRATGTTNAEKRDIGYVKHTIICGTPQTIEKDLVRGTLNAAPIGLIIYDEAHRAVGSYAYVNVAKFLSNAAAGARSIGLTASPGSNKRKLAEIMGNLRLEHLEIRGSDDPDIVGYVAPCVMTWRTVPLDRHLVKILSVLKRKHWQQVKYLVGKGVLKEREKFSRARLKAYAQRAESRSRPGEQTLLTVYTSAHLSHLIELLETQGVAAGARFLRDQARKVASNAIGTASARALLTDPQLRDAFRDLINMERESAVHPKFKTVLQVLSEAGLSIHDFEPAASKHRPFLQEDSKILVFTNYRATAIELAEFFRKHDVKAQHFIGQQNKVDEPGMTHRIQKETLENFRKHKIQLLTATSVIEEGLDVAECDLVIMYDAVPSAIRQIQRRGRTARKRVGRVVGLIAQNTRDEVYRRIAERNEQGIYSVLRNGKRPMFKNDRPNNQPAGGQQSQIEPQLESAANLSTQIESNASAGKGREHSAIAYNQTDRGRESVEPATGFSVVRATRKATLTIRTAERSSSVTRRLLVAERLRILFSDKLSVPFAAKPDVGIIVVNSRELPMWISDGRLFADARIAVEEYDHRFLLIIGSERSEVVSADAIFAALAAMSLNHGFSIVQLRNSKEATQFITHLAEKRFNAEATFNGAFRSRKKKTMDQRLIQALSAIPNVNTAIAENLLVHFGTISEVAAADRTSLCDVSKVGTAKSAEISAFMHHRYKEEEQNQ